MKHFEVLNEILKKSGESTLKKATTVKESKTKGQQEKVVKNKENKRIKESEILYKQLDAIIETAMRDTVKNTIMENTDVKNLKKKLMTLENVELTEDQLLGFTNDTIDPIIETVGAFNSPRFSSIKDKTKIKSVSLPVYEIALTLESARYGALTPESLQDVVVKENIEPTLMEINTLYMEQVEEKAQELEDLGTSSEVQNYNMGNSEETETSEKADNVVSDNPVKDSDGGSDSSKEANLTDRDQNLKNDMWKLPTQGGGSPPDQSYRHDEEPDFESDKNIKTYEGDTAGDPDNGLPDAPMVESAKRDKKSRITVVKKLMEELNVTDEDVIDQSESDIKTYEGNPAGEADEDLSPSELTNDGTSDEAIVQEVNMNANIQAAKYLIGSILKEYGINNMDIAKAYIREAVRCLYRYGALNLYPAVSDVSSLVVNQNEIAYKKGLKESATIVKQTRPVYSKNQINLIRERGKKYLDLLKKVNIIRESSSKEQYDEVYPTSDWQKYIPSGEKTRYEELNENKTIEAIKTITTASLIERTRQAFRYRINKFDDLAKKSVVECWRVSIPSDPKRLDFANQITIRKYVEEADDMKEYLENKLGKVSPIFESCVKKAVLNNDSLVTASLFTEMVTYWTSIKRNYYINQPIQNKIIALEQTISTANGCKALFGAMKNPEKGKQLIEDFQYRLQSLLDKAKLANKKK